MMARGMLGKGLLYLMIVFPKKTRKIAVGEVTASRKFGATWAARHGCHHGHEGLASSGDGAN